MYHFYMDETFYGKQGSQLIVQGGFIVDETNILNLQTQLWYLKNQFGLNNNDPIKWSPPQGKLEYKAQRAIKKQNEFREEVLKLITNLGLSLVVAIIHESKLNRTYDTAFYQNNALDFLAKRFQYFLRAKTNIKGDNYNPSGLIIADHPGTARESQMSDYYSQIWQKTSSNNVKLCFLRESILYSHCKCCCPLQLADFVVGATRMRASDPKNNFFKLIKSGFRKESGSIIGAGIVIFPSSSPLAKNFT